MARSVTLTVGLDLWGQVRDDHVFRNPHLPHIMSFDLDRCNSWNSLDTYLTSSLDLWGKIRIRKVSVAKSYLGLETHLYRCSGVGVYERDTHMQTVMLTLSYIYYTIYQNILVYFIYLPDICTTLRTPSILTFLVCFFSLIGPTYPTTWKICLYPVVHAFM